MKVCLETEPKDLVPELRFHGETCADKEEVQKIKDVDELSSEAIRQLMSIADWTKNRSEYSAVELHTMAMEKLKETQEWLNEFFESLNEMEKKS